MKVSIIGGGGLVGSSAAYALQCGGIVSHLCLIDANQDAARGHALELLHSASLTADIRLSAGTMEDVATSNIVVITAGLRRKPDESRLAQAVLATRSLAANLLVVEMPGRTFFEVRQILRMMCADGACCPAGVACTLTELDGHAHR